MGVHRYLRRAVPCLALTLLVGTSALAATRTPARRARSTTPTFLIAGSVDGLVPGVSQPLVLTVTNPNDVGIKVTKLKARVMADAVHPDCDPASYVRTSTFDGPLKVPTNKSRTTNLSIKMLAGAPDACQGATFVLHFSGTAVKA